MSKKITVKSNRPEMILQTDNRGNTISGSCKDEPNKHFQARICIGIDPDINKSGVGVYDRRERKLIRCESMDYFALLELLQEYDEIFHTTGQTYIVNIEGSWLERKSNWHNNMMAKMIESSITQMKTCLKFQKFASMGGVIATLEKYGNAQQLGLRDKISESVGQNHGAGKMIMAACIRYGHPFRICEIRTPIFKDERRFKMMTKWEGRTNEDARSGANYSIQ